MKLLLPLVMLVSPLLISAHLRAADDAQLLRAKLTDTASLKAHFTQTVTDVNHKVIQQGSGEFALAYPNQFYWHLTAPDESKIVADGTAVWIYNPFAEEVMIMDMADAINASPIALLVHRDDATWSQYRVSQQADCFNITPVASRLAQENVTAVNVCFNQQAQLNQFTVADDKGNLSRFTLSAQQPITVSDKLLFSFTLPDNVDIDDQRQQAKR